MQVLGVIMNSQLYRTTIFFFFVILSCLSCYFSFIHNPKAISTQQLEPSTQAQQTSTSFIGSKKTGFNSLTQECPKISIACKGTLPTWLQGDLLGTGPAQFELGQTNVKYWFNGLAMLHAFHIQNGNLEYHNKFLESEYYKRSMNNGKFDSTMSTEKPKGFFSRLAGAMSSNNDPYDNGTIAITKINNTFVALTETPLHIAFDPKTLATTELFKFDDNLEGHLTTAQFQYDPITNEWFNYMIEFANNSNYHVYKIKNGENKRTLITSIPVKSPSYMRSFGMTKNYIILVEIPFVVNPFDLLMAAGAFVETVSWKPKLGTNLIVVNKHTGELIGTYKTDALFMFNTINAFEIANKIVLDLVAHKDSSLIACTTLEALRNNTQKEFSSSYIKRLEIDLAKNNVSQKQLAQHSIEFPVINKEYAMKDYSFVYGLGAHNQDAFPHHVIKLNIKTGECLTWSEQGCYASAPVFVARPQTKEEDDGIIFSVVFDSNKQHSFLLILDAQKLSENARFMLPHHIPLGLIAQFYGA